MSQYIDTGIKPDSLTLRFNDKPVMRYEYIPYWNRHLSVEIVEDINEEACKAIREKLQLGGITDALILDNDFILRAIQNALSEEKANEPLSLEQLRQMDGEPVWIVWPDGRIDSRWWIVGNHDWHLMEFFDPYAVPDYGKTWIAYRRKPADPDK